MKTIKRELLLCFTLSALVFVCALAWGSPFLSVGSGTAHAQQQASLEQQTAVLVKGTILRSGEQFFLRDASGQSFRLEDARDVRPFEGKDVTISGRLDQQNNIIRVERIESATV